MKLLSKTKLIRLVLILAIVIATAFAVTLITSASSEPKLVYNVTIGGLLDPEAGRIPDYELDPRVSTYTATVQWFEKCDDGTYLHVRESEKVHAGKAYKAVVHVTTIEGYEFNVIPTGFKISINGNDITEYRFNSSTHLYFEVLYPTLEIQPVKDVDITIDAPIAGRKPDFEADITGDCRMADFTSGGWVNGILWEDLSTGRLMGPEDEFVGGRRYSAKFYLVSDSDHTFEGALSYCVDVNGRLTTLSNDDLIGVNGVKDKIAYLTFTATETVNEVNITDLYSVAPGANPDFYLETDNEDITVEEVTWGKRENIDGRDEYVAMDENDVFEDGGSYLLTVRLYNGGAKIFGLDEYENPDVYSKLAGSVAIAAQWRYYNDSGELMTYNPHRYVELRFVIDCKLEVIDQIDILSIPTPEAGEKPSKGFAWVTNDELMIADVVWYSFVEVDGVYKYVKMAENETFQKGVIYSVDVIVCIKNTSDKVFAVNEELNNHWIDATVNGKTANGVYKYYDENGDYVDPYHYAIVTCSFTCNSDVVENVDISATAPVAGQLPSYDVIFHNYGYYNDPSANGSSGTIINGQWVDLYYAKKGVAWYDVTEDEYGTEVYENQAFIGGHRYELRVTLLAATNYKFAADNNNNSLVAAKINGKEADIFIRNMAYNEIQVTYVFECPVVMIDEIDLIIPEPVIGELPSFDKIDTDMYYSEKDESWNDYFDGDAGLLWLDDTAGVYMVPGTDRFKDNGYYSVVVKLVIKEGYELDFSNLQLYVNGCRVDMGFALGNVIALSFRFDPTECYHNIVAVDETSATCLDDGMIAHYECDKCGQLYADANGDQLIDEGEDWTIIRAEGHKFDEVTPTGVNTHTAICSVCGEEEDQDCVYSPEYVEGPSEYSKYNATVFICQCGAFSHLSVRPDDCDHELSDPIGIEGAGSHYRICACESVVEEETCNLVVSYVKGPSDYAERDVIIYTCTECGIFTMTPIEGEIATKDEVVDEETGITVSTGEGAAEMPEDVTLNVEQIDESKISEEEMNKISQATGGKAEYVAGYDLSLGYGDYGYSIFESVVVFIPIEDYNPEYKYTACYLTDEYQYVVSSVCVNYDDKESVAFVADHFSIYIIVRVDESAPEHQHNFVNGECECGEKDPTYVPENPEDPKDPENPENPEDPKDPETPETPEDPKDPENPEDPETPEDPKDPENPEDPVEKDHSKCLEEASGWKRFWNAIGNFFRRIFTGYCKCVCGDKVPEDDYTEFKKIFKQNR